MGTQLTGASPYADRVGLIKTSDKAALSSTIRNIGDGAGNDSGLHLGINKVGFNEAVDMTKTSTEINNTVVKAAYISVTKNVDLDAIETNSNASKTKTDFLTVSQPVDLDTIESRVNELDASVILKGGWDASAGTFPGAGIAQAGWSYIITVAGTVDGVSFSVNDRIVAILDNASTSTYASNWLKLDYTDQVLSVNGNTGAVTLSTADIADSADKRYVTDAQEAKIDNISITQAVNLDTIETDVTNLKALTYPIQVKATGAGLAISAGTAKTTFRMPYAMTVTEVRASLTTAQTSGNIFTVDINDGGTSILSTKLTIDNGEKTSTTAATPAVISDTALADDAEITIDVDQIGDGTAVELLVTIIGTR